jgi:uracil DNA glycosylase
MAQRDYNPADDGMSQQQFDELLAVAIKECRREKLFPRDHRIFLAGLVVGLTAMKLVVLYV